MTTIAAVRSKKTGGTKSNPDTRRDGFPLTADDWQARASRRMSGYFTR